VMGTEATNTYMRFSVGFPTTQSYNFTVRCGNGGGDIAQFHLNLDGNALSSVVTVNPLGAWPDATWQSVDAGSFSVTAGTHVVTWYVDDQYVDFSAILITPVTNTGTTLQSAVTMPAIGGTVNATLTTGSASPFVGSWYTVNGAAVQVTLASGSNVTLFNGGAANNAGITSLSGAFTARSTPTTGQESVKPQSGTNPNYVYGLNIPPFAAVIPSVTTNVAAPNAVSDTRSTLTPAALLANGRMNNASFDPTNQGVGQSFVTNRAASGTFTTLYAANRADGVSGAGTKTDPLDWSSAAKISASVGSNENRCYHIAKGTYTWNTPNSCLKNVQYLGAGFDQTVLNNTGFAPFTAPDFYNCDYWAAMDLSANCNNSVTTASTGGMVYRGNHTRAIRCHFYGWGHPVTGGNEWFPFFMSGYPDLTDVWVDNVWDRLLIDKPVDSAASAGTTVCGIGSSRHQGRYDDTNIISHCYMGPGLWYAWNRNGQGYAHGFYAPEVTGCTTDDIETGNYVEPGRYTSRANADASWGIIDENHNVHANTYINNRSPLHFQYSAEGGPSTLREGQLAGTETWADNTCLYQGLAGAAMDTSVRNMWSVDTDDAISLANHINEPCMNVVIIRNNSYVGLNNNRDGGIRTNFATLGITSLTITNNAFTSFGNSPAIQVNRSQQPSITSSGNTLNTNPITIP
jgi:hypothetical protein